MSCDIKIKRKLLSLFILLTLLFLLLIIIITPPVKGYEISIYNAYPEYFWILTSINIFFSIYIVITSIDFRTYDWIYGYFSILLIESIILLLPIIRGYYSMNRGSGDIYYHLAVANFISNFGHLPQTDFYPIMHILLSILHISTLDWIKSALFLSIIFFLGYIAYLYIFGKLITGNKKGGIFTSLFGIPLIYSFAHYAFYPYFFALLSIPIILFIYQKILIYRDKINFYIPLLLIFFFIVFCHPSITFFLIIIFLIFFICNIIIKSKYSEFNKNIAFNFMIILFISFFIWLIQFPSLLNNIKTIIQVILGQHDKITIAEFQLDLIKSADVSIWLIIERYIKVYGSFTIYFLLSFFIIINLIKNYYKKMSINIIHVIYSNQFIGSFIFSFLMIFSYFIIFEPIRALSNLILFAIFICGMAIHQIWDSINSKKQKSHFILFLSIFFTIICMLCIFNLYSSPWKSEANTALSYGEKKGIDWLLEYREEGIPLTMNGLSIRTYPIFYFSNKKNFIYEMNIPYFTEVIPSHFGYDKNNTIEEIFKEYNYNNLYIITTRFMILLPEAVSPDRRDYIKHYTNADFIRLNSDTSVKLIYSNGELFIRNIDIY